MSKKAVRKCKKQEEIFEKMKKTVYKSIGVVL